MPGNAHGKTMTETLDTEAGSKIDYSKTLYLPQTDFPMRAGLPEKEPLLVKRWLDMDLYKLQREDAAGRPKYVLHDGPPYANGNIHIGHALNKVLKDIITRSFQMRGYDSNYVPGWDCHGLPIEWKIEEEYRAKGKEKPNFKDGAEMNAFRKECRDFAAHWIKVQGAEFQRLGVVGDFDNPYTTMNFHAEARIAGELMKFAMSDQLYRGSKPVMWSVVERTALAEAEVEYQDYESDTIWVKFPIVPKRHVGYATFRQTDREATSVEMHAATDLGTRLCRYLDDDALDHSRQPRRSHYSRRGFSYGLYDRSARCRTDIRATSPAKTVDLCRGVG